MKPLRSEDIAERLDKIRSTLTGGARLVAVSKFHPAEYIEMAHAAGQRLFGESRVQELVEKWEGLRERYPDLIWHFIGPLQTNKVKYIAPFIHMIESVTSERLLLEICRQAQRVGRTIPILLEVHVAREETKSGFSPPTLPTNPSPSPTRPAAAISRAPQPFKPQRFVCWRWLRRRRG